MRIRPLCIVLLAAALIAGAGFASFFAMRGGLACPATRDKAILLDELDELAWMKKELKLTPAQMDAVARLHHAYRPHCEEMCRRIAEADRLVMESAKREPRPDPALDAAIRNAADERARCMQAMIGHLHETASQLEPDQARRYLEVMVPMALGIGTTEDGHGGH